MKRYSIEPIPKDTAKSIIVNNHYSHKWTSCRYALGLFDNHFEDDPVLVGVAVYGYPVGRQVVKSISDILNNDDVLELTRLWLRDEEPKNSESYFLGLTFWWLRYNTTVKVLISYSDPMYNHLGIIYQATNWLYQGNSTMLVKGYLHRILGVVMHPRSVVAKYGTLNAAYLLSVDKAYTRIETKKKHRYIYILNRRIKRQLLSSLKHPILPYPKKGSNDFWE